MGIDTRVLGGQRVVKGDLLLGSLVIVVGTSDIRDLFGFFLGLVELCLEVDDGGSSDADDGTMFLWHNGGFGKPS